jgi:molybdopterin molybdotransferase
MVRDMAVPATTFAPPPICLAFLGGKQCNVTSMISVDQALAIVLGAVKPLPAESIPLEFAARRILAEEVRADMDLPPFDRARMDGFALRSQDAAIVPATLQIIGEVAAGATFEGTVGPGEAVKIFTGAPLPHGADAVQKVEVTETTGGSVVVNEAVTQGQFVTPRANEGSAGDIVATAGREIGAAEMSVLASFGYSTVRVGAQPRVAVLSTGSELIEVSEKPTGAHIRNSNTYTLGAYAVQAGAKVRTLGVVKDTIEASRSALIAAAESSDIVITSGGVSMGDYDLVKMALVDIGADIFFDKVSIRPGKPTVFARRGDTFFFGLPGNPVSVSVTFNVFARPAIRQMMGDRTPALPVVSALAASGGKDGSSRRSYLPARFFVQNGQALAEPLKWGGSSDFVAFMNANALIIVPEDKNVIAEREQVEVMLLAPI